MKLTEPLPNEAYDALRNIQFELEEVTLTPEENLEHAAGLIARIKERVLGIILAADLAALEKPKCRHKWCYSDIRCVKCGLTLSDELSNPL